MKAHSESSPTAQLTPHVTPLDLPRKSAGHIVTFGQGEIVVAGQPMSFPQDLSAGYVGPL